MRQFDYPSHEWVQLNALVCKIREQWYYNNEHQQVVTSIHLVKTFVKLPVFEPTPAGPSEVSLMLCQLSYW